MLKLSKIRDICFPDEARKKDPYRKIGIYGVWVLLHTSITPNQITLVRLIFLFLGAYMFYLKMALLGAIIFQFCIILDTFDGAIARFKRLGSKTGELFDFFVDHFSSTILYFVAVSLFFNTNVQYIIALISVLFANSMLFLRLSYKSAKIDIESQKEKFFFRLFYQDNARFIVNCITLFFLVSLFLDFSIFLAYFLLMFNILKIIYLVIFFHVKSDNFILSKKIIKGIITQIKNAINSF